jgi:dihydrolipoamide dehydrogenase
LVLAQADMYQQFVVQLGFKTAIIEKYPVLGGTCLNVGCIPSKSLLASSHHYSDVAHFADHGIEISGEVNLEKMIARKQAIVDQTTGGVKYLMDKNKITVLEGLGSFVDATHVAIAKTDGTIETVEAKKYNYCNGIEAC